MKPRIERSLTLLTAALSLAGASLLSAVPVCADELADKSDLFLTRKLASRPQSGWSEVIVKTTGGDLTASQEARIKALGGYVYRHLGLIDAAAVRIPNRAVRRLAALPFVKRLSTDAAVRKTDEFIVERSGADVAHDSYALTGAGVGIAVLDSGIDPRHPDLRATGSRASRVVAQVNFVPGSSRTDDPCGHGTHIAGIIAGNGASSTGSRYFRTFHGIARGANLVSVRVLDRLGQGSVSSVISGINWVINNRQQYNIRVLNLSLGHAVGESYATDPLCQAVEQAYHAGIVVVCAAGNNGRAQSVRNPLLGNEGYGARYGSIQSPANDPYVITVGATKSHSRGRAYDQIATYSGRGPTRLDRVLKPDIIAPGNRVISTNKNSSYLDNTFKATNSIPLSSYSLTNGQNIAKPYFVLSGTSMAAPVVAGAAALLLERDPALTPDTIKARLMISADKWGFPNGATDVCTFGAGYLNIPAALKSTVIAQGPALSPPLLWKPGGRILVDGNRVIWGPAGEVWGIPEEELGVPIDALGTLGVDATRIIWGGANILEDMSLSASRVLWGEVVWLDQFIWDETLNEVDLSSTAIKGEE